MSLGRVHARAMDDETERLDEALTALADLADLTRRIKLRSECQAVHRWSRGRGLNARNQELVASELGLPPDFFVTTEPLGHIKAER